MILHILMLVGGLAYLILARNAFRVWYYDWKEDWNFGYLVAGLLIALIGALFFGWEWFSHEKNKGRLNFHATKALGKGSDHFGAFLAGDREAKVERQARRIRELKARNAELEKELGL